MTPDEIVAAAVRFAELEAFAAQGWLNGKFHNPAPSAETAARAALRAVAGWCKERAESKAANASVGMQTAYRHVERKLREIAGGGEEEDDPLYSGDGEPYGGYYRREPEEE